MNGLVSARNRLCISSSIVLDFLIRGFCAFKRVEDALECFYMMKYKGIRPKIETCNCNEKAWVLYAEMFQMKLIQLYILLIL